jgi:hypothetical protein
VLWWLRHRCVNVTGMAPDDAMAPGQPSERGRIDQRVEVAVIGDPPAFVQVEGDRGLIVLMYGALTLRGTHADLMRLTATLWQRLKDAQR